MSELSDACPGSSSGSTQHRETTLVVEPGGARSRRRAYLRDELGFTFLSDLTAVDYLGWGARGVSGYIGTAGGRDLNTPMTQGLPGRAGAEAQAVRASTTTCSRSATAPSACACRRGSTTASRCRR